MLAPPHWTQSLSRRARRFLAEVALGGVGFRDALCRGGAGVYRGRLVLVGSWILGRGALFHLLRGLRVVTVLRDGLSHISRLPLPGERPQP